MGIRGMCCLLAGLVLAATTCAAFAVGPRAVRKQAEASMLVTGRVMIERDGSVNGWTIDQREKLPEVVASLVDGAVPTWKFDPVLVDGQPVRGSARMSLRVKASRAPDDSGDFSLSIGDGYFGRDALDAGGRESLGLEGEYVSRGTLKPPQYPLAALQSNVQGTVYLALRVNRQGAVDEVVAEQVNLRSVGSERSMKWMRDTLSGAAVKAARGWTFRPPTVGESVDDAFWSVRVPVDYAIGDAEQAGYGQWAVYIPGPRAPVPWRNVREEDGASPDTLVAGEIYQAGAGLKLLTPIGG